MIIGIIGKAGAGKDTVAEMIIEEYSISKTNVSDSKIKRPVSYRPFNIAKFADGLKRSCAAITGLQSDYFYDRSNYGYVIYSLGITVRELMQKVGTGLRETVDKDIWVKTALMKCAQNLNYVFTDVRFPNEVEAIRNLGGMIIHIIRNDYEDESLKSEESKNHISETALDNYPINANITVLNNGDLEDLRKMVKQIVIKKIQEWEDNLNSDNSLEKNET